MRLFHFLSIVVFILVTGVYAWFHFYNQANTDLTIPQITFETDVLEVAVDADESALLRDVRAQDEKDGDLTARVIVERISNFVEKGLSNITYAVVDNDRHTVKATRRIRYIDYRSPRFTFSQAMRFDAGSGFNILKSLGAVDMIDGDISNKVKLTGSDLLVNTPGNYKMQAQVTNSKGDVSYLHFNVTIVQPRRGALHVNLTDYLVYLKRDAGFDPNVYFKDVTLNDLPVTNYKLEVSSQVATNIVGSYQVYYMITDERGNIGETDLAVIVEE
jgi:hypothetical protein